MKKRVLSVFVALLVLFCMIPSCFAEEITQDGLKVVLATDKAAYKENEAITATLTVTNINEFAVSNVSLQNMVDDGYEVVEGSQTTKAIESLQPQESVALATTVKTTLVPDFEKKLASSEQKENSNSEAGQKASKNVNTGISDHPGKSLIAVGLILLAVALLYYLVKKNKGKWVISVLLGCAIVGSSMMIMAASPSAAEALSKIELSTQITVEEKEVEFKSVVSYSAADQAMSLTIADILPEDFPRTDDPAHPPVKAWKTADDKSCFVSDTYIYFSCNGAEARDDLRMSVTKNGNDYTFGSITFIMSGKTLERIEYKSDNPYYSRCNGIYNPPVHGLEVFPTSLKLKVGETATFTLKSLSGKRTSVVLSCPNCISTTTSMPYISGDDPVEISIKGETAGSGEIVFYPMDPRLGPEVLSVTVTN